MPFRHLKSAIAYTLCATFIATPFTAEAGRRRTLIADGASRFTPAPYKSRGPASVAPVVGSSSKKIEIPPAERSSQMLIDGKPVTLVERTNQLGRVTHQILLSKGRQEIGLDQDGDGHLDFWEMRTRDARVELRSPVQGRFMIMEVDQKTAAGTVNMKFALNPAGEYGLYAQRLLPYVRQFMVYEDVTVGCLGTSDSEKSLAKYNDQLQDYLSGDDKSKALTEFGKGIKEKLVDSSCDSGKFKDSKASIVDGIMKVLTSDEKPKENPPAKKGTYLQCLRSLNLNVHAARILTGLGNYSDKMPEGGFFGWKVTCEEEKSASNDTRINSIEGKSFGSYTNSGLEPPTISFHQPKDVVSKYAEQRLGGDLTNSYASIFFHEMLHYSLIEDENLTAQVQNCCSTEAEHADCDKVRDFTAKKANAQRITGQRASIISNYPQVIEKMRETYGTGADKIMEDFDMDAGELYSKYGGNSAEFKSKLSKLVDEYFSTDPNSKCMERAGRTMDDAKAKRACTAIYAFAKETNGIDPKALENAGICKKNQTSISTPGSSFIAFLAMSAMSSADLSNSVFCESDGKAIDYANLGLYSSNKVDPISQKMAAGGTTGDGPIANGSGSSAVVKRPSGSHTKIDAKGPSLPNFKSPSQRQMAIESQLEKSDSLLNQTRRLAETFSQQVLPSAQAAGGKIQNTRIETSTDGSRRTVSLDSASNSASRRDPPKLPSISVPNILNANVAGPALNAGNGSSQAIRLGGNARAGANGAANGGRGASNETRGSGADGRSPSNSGAVGKIPGGVGANGAGLQGSGKVAMAKPVSAAEERALKTLLTFLQKPWREVKPELARPSFVSSLLHHQVQVVDDENRVHGSGQPKHKLVYDQDKDRLAVQAP